MIVFILKGNFMDNSSILRHVKAKFGGFVNSLELSDEEMTDILLTSTLEKISITHPKEVTVMVKRIEEAVPFQPEIGRFYINTEETIINIAQFLTPNNMAFSYGATNIDPFASAMDIGGDMENAYIPRFEAPNTLVISPNPPIGWLQFLVRLNVVHSDFNTVKPGLLLSVQKVAAGDITEYILGERANFNEINSEFGSINLQLDKLEDAITKRDEVLQDLSDKIVLQSNRRKVWFA
jgi:hypothetical protein